MKRTGVFVLLFLFSFSFALAAENCSSFDKPKSSSDFFNQIESMNSALATCPIQVPTQLQKVINHGVLVVDIVDAKSVYITISNGNIASVSLSDPGKYVYRVRMTSCVLNDILSKQDSLNAFAAYYLSGQAKLSAGGFVSKIKLFFLSPFIKSGLKQMPATETVACAGDLTPKNKPTNCYETYMEGHKEYQYGKKNWDEWKAKTKGVCQTQNAEAPKDGKCEYLFEQISGNDKKWLCWYN